MNFTPLNGHIVIRELDADRQTKGGIILPDNAQKKSQRGVVLFAFEPYINKDGERVKPQVKPGDLVLFPKYEGEEFEFGNVKVMILKDSVLRGIFRDDPEPSQDLVADGEMFSMSDGLAVGAVAS